MRDVERLKDEVKTLLGAPSLIQRDREGRALFFSDFLSRCDSLAKARLEAAGFTVQAAGSYALIDLSDKRLRAFYEALPACSIPPMNEANALMVSAAGMLLRHQAPLEKQPLFPLRRALLLADKGDMQDLALYMQRCLADALRERTPAPSALAALMLCCIKEDMPC